MTWPVTFSLLTGGRQPLSLFDTMFGAVASMIPIPCMATGTSVITLTPFDTAPSLPAYGLQNLFSFIAAADSSGPVTISFASLPPLPVYRLGGTVQVSTGDMKGGYPYMVMYSASLNGGAGGFHLLDFATAAVGPISAAKLTAYQASGTYTPSAGMVAALMCGVGAGGGGGAVEASAGQGASGGGGGAGAFSLTLVQASMISGPLTVSVGQGGDGGADGPNDGADGGPTAVGSFLNAPGGKGGKGHTTPGCGQGGDGGDAGSGILVMPGGDGGDGFRAITTIETTLGGMGGGSFFGSGGRQLSAWSDTQAFNGQPGRARGSGGSGACNARSGTAASGGRGANGCVFILEFMHS